MNSTTMTLLAIGTVVGVAVMAKPKRRKRRPSGDVVVDDPDVVIDEVPVPSEASAVFSGYQESPNVGSFVDWWVSEFEGKFGWQYTSRTDDVSEMSYLDGLIYHYPSAQDAFDDLMRVLE